MNKDFTYRLQEHQTHETKDTTLSITNRLCSDRCLQTRLIAYQDVQGHTSLTIEINEINKGDADYHEYRFGKNGESLSYQVERCKKGTTKLEKKKLSCPPFVESPLLGVKQMIKSTPLPDILAHHPAIIAIKRMQEE